MNNILLGTGAGFFVLIMSLFIAYNAGKSEGKNSCEAKYLQIDNNKAIEEEAKNYLFNKMNYDFGKIIESENIKYIYVPGQKQIITKYVTVNNGNCFVDLKLQKLINKGWGNNELYTTGD